MKDTTQTTITFQVPTNVVVVSRALKNIALALISIWLFMVALQMIKGGIAAIDTKSVLFDHIRTFLNQPFKSFGIGWLGTSIILSGSPVTAIGITMFNSNILSDTTSLAMLIFGSRGGPDLILFLVGIATLLKGRSISQSFTLGIIEFFTTTSVIIVSTILYMMFFDDVRWGASVVESLGSVRGYSGILDLAVNPLVDYVYDIVPPAFGILAGLGTLGCAVVLFDKFFSFLKVRTLDANPDSHSPITRWWYRWRFTNQVKNGPWLLRWMHNYLKLPVLAFLLGALVTGITMSTAVSVSLLVPFFAYGMITDRSAIAYIIAANVTTFSDTLFLAVITHNPAIVSVVLGVMASVTICAALFLGLFRYYGRFIRLSAAWVSARPSRLIATVAIALLVPLPLLLYA